RPAVDIGAHGAYYQGIEQVHQQANQRLGGAHVFQNENLPARPDHPPNLAESLNRVGHRAEDKGRNHSVESVIWKIETLHVTHVQINLAIEIGSSFSGALEHAGS